MHCLSEKLISKILFSAKLHSSGIDFPYSTVVGTVTTINLGSAFEMPRMPPPRLAVPHLCLCLCRFAATKRRLSLLLHIQLYVLAHFIAKTKN